MAHQAPVTVFVVVMLVIFWVTDTRYCDFGLHSSQMEMEASDPNEDSVLLIVALLGLSETPLQPKINRGTASEKRTK